MRQKAVSIAPQKEAPIQIAAIAATTPIVAELSRMRSTTPASESCSALGKICWRSWITVWRTSALSITWPKMNRTRSTNGNSASARL